jgi:hypothetical protein
LVCGGRTFVDYNKLVNELDRINEECGGIKIIIEGEATGADTLAACWAICRGIPVLGISAEWDKYGKQAGFIRNKKMLETGKPDLTVAFPGGLGTTNMILLSRRAGVKTMVIS